MALMLFQYSYPGQDSLDCLIDIRIVAAGYRRLCWQFHYILFHIESFCSQTRLVCFYQLDTIRVLFAFEYHAFVACGLCFRATAADWFATLDAHLFLLLRIALLLLFVG